MSCILPVRPIQWSLCLCSNSVSNFFHKVLFLLDGEQTKKKYEAEIEHCNNKIIEQQDTIYRLQNKIYNLVKLHNEYRGFKSKTIPAEIIGYDTSLFRKNITINIGSKHGIKQNHIVVANNALVGRISSVDFSTSTVQLITDPASRIPGKVLRTREQVIIEGNASHFCTLKYVPRWTKLKKGDDIVTSNIGGFYLSSLPVATVIEYEKKGGALFQYVKVLPKVNILNLESVLVIVNEH